MEGLSFSKMHCNGNDFMVISTLDVSTLDLKVAKIKELGNRHTGVGFDQLLIITPTNNSLCDFNYYIFNSDGTQADQCGNGLSAVAYYTIKKKLTTKNVVKFQTIKTQHSVQMTINGTVSTNMGFVNFNKDPNIVVLTESKGIAVYKQFVNKQIVSAYYASVGNPHLIFIVDDPNQINFKQLIEEQHISQNFINGVNISVMKIINRNNIQIRVHERGVGETLACGSATTVCSALGMRLNLLNNRVKVSMAGGNLIVEKNSLEEYILSSNPILVYEGTLSQEREIYA